MLVDCPPVLAVSDAQIVGQLVDGAILVVRPEKNHRRSVMRAVDSFHGAGCRVLGVVANGLSNDASGYGYGYSYGYDDGYGHTTEAEPTIELPPVATDPAPTAPAPTTPTPTTPTPIQPTRVDGGKQLPPLPTVPIRRVETDTTPPVRPRRAA